MSAAMAAYDHLWRGLGRRPTVAEMAVQMGVRQASAHGHLSMLRRYGHISDDGEPTWISEAAARAALRSAPPPSGPPLAAPGEEERSAILEDEGVPPLNRALLTLPRRATVLRGEYRLDGRRVSPRELIAAANAVLRSHGLPEIRYPGLSPHVVARCG